MKPRFVQSSYRIGRPRRSGAALLLIPALLVAHPVLASSESDWATASDIGVGSLTAWSIGGPLLEGDGAGALRAGGSIGAGYAGALLLKEVFPETRPDRSKRDSFPSGHTSAAFAAAVSIFNRRGPAEGIPALAVAGMVGVARIEANKHYWYDVVAGAAVGTTSGMLIARSRNSSRSVVGWGDTHGAGLTYSADF